MPLTSYLGISPVIADETYIHASAEVIGDVSVGKNCSIWCNAVVRGDVNRISIGEGSNIQDFAMCHVTHKNASNPEGYPLIIGKHVTIAHAVVLHGCTIEDECLIGIGSIVMDNAVVEKNVMVGAGSLVPPGKRLESGHLYVGRPAAKVRALSAEEIAHLKYSAEHYIRVKNNYIAEKQNTQ
jgi:carbonic anhydrase/acetyltransferase-like protein (isoleucine patch superfamily)